MISEKDAADGWRVERWAYKGVRETSDHKLCHTWHGPNGDGEPLIFLKVKAGAVGGVYEVEVQREDGEFKSARLAVKYTGDREWDENLIAEWKTKDRLAKVALARRRKERKAAEGDEFRDAVAPLKALMDRSTTWTNRSAFVAMVVDELYRGKR
jgi:hypothetical protein